MGTYNANARADAVIPKANAQAASRERALELLAGIVDRRRKACFDTLVEPIRQRHREQEAMHKEDVMTRRVAREQAREQAQEQKKKAELEQRERLACLVYQAQLEKEKVEREKEAQKQCGQCLGRQEEEEGAAMMN